MLDVVILTDERFVNPTESNEYTSNVLFEDQLVMTGLIKRGLSVKKVAWSDPNFDWKSAKYALFRTTWDYAEKFTEFADWLMDVAFKTKLINSYDLVSWNLDKHYLNDLKQEGIQVVETYFIQPKDSRSLTQVHQELGWKNSVLKPAISASAKNTFKLSEETLSEHEEIYSELISEEAMMVQPFLDSIIARGEISLVMIGGVFTHAVIKKAKPGDFRVQDDFGGSVEDYTPTQAEIDLAIKTVNACETLPLYARVDIANDPNGDPAIMELEILEPEMWFRRNTDAADQLAEEIAKLF
ncbi:MAG: hypothetical protein ABJP45_00435 [Cyclobacteriaceae bacterium]